MCAETFNPDDDDEDTEPRVVHPKTDEQRCRLQEACRDILLFKTLDQVNSRIIENTDGVVWEFDYINLIDRGIWQNVDVDFPATLKHCNKA